MGFLENRMRKGLYQRLIRAGLKPELAADVAAANYPSASHSPTRQPIISTDWVQMATAKFLDPRALDNDAQLLILTVFGTMLDEDDLN